MSAYCCINNPTNKYTDMVYIPSRERVAKNTIVLYVRMLLIVLVGFLSTRIIYKSLGEIDFGLYNLILGITAFLAYFNTCLSTSTSRFLTYEIGIGNKRKIKEVFRTVFMIHLLLAIIVFAIGELIGYSIIYRVLNIPDVKKTSCYILYHLTILICVVNIIKVPFDSLVISTERMSFYAYISIIDALGKLSIGILIFYYAYDRLVLFGILQFSLSIIVLLCSIRYCKLRFNSYLDVRMIVNWKSTKNIFLFTSWNLLGSTANILRTQGLNLLFNIFFGPVTNAANAISNQINTTVSKFCSSFTMAISPQITKTYANKQIKETRNLVFSGSKISFALMNIFVVPFLIGIKTVLHLWLGEFPIETVYFSKCCLLISLVDSISYTSSIAIQATGKIKTMQITVSCFLLCIIPISYLLFRLHYEAYYGYIISLSISVIVMWVRLHFMQTILGFRWIDFLNDVLIRCSIIFIVSYFSITLLCNLFYNENIRLIVSIVLSLIINIILTYFIGLNKKEKIYVINIVKSKIYGR